MVLLPGCPCCQTNVCTKGTYDLPESVRVTLGDAETIRVRHIKWVQDYYVGGVLFKQSSATCVTSPLIGGTYELLRNGSDMFGDAVFQYKSPRMTIRNNAPSTNNEYTLTATIGTSVVSSLIKLEARIYIRYARVGWDTVDNVNLWDFSTMTADNWDAAVPPILGKDVGVWPVGTSDFAIPRASQQCSGGVPVVVAGTTTYPRLEFTIRDKYYDYTLEPPASTMIENTHDTKNTTGSFSTSTMRYPVSVTLVYAGGTTVKAF